MLSGAPARVTEAGKLFAVCVWRYGECTLSDAPARTPCLLSREQAHGSGSEPCHQRREGGAIRHAMKTDSPPTTTPTHIHVVYADASCRGSSHTISHVMVAAQTHTQAMALYMRLCRLWKYPSFKKATVAAEHRASTSTMSQVLSDQFQVLGQPSQSLHSLPFAPSSALQASTSAGLQAHASTPPIRKAEPSRKRAT
jgi:hypothetical protein